jgi:hypothetical protein
MMMTIPTRISQFSHLTELDLRNNGLSSTLPSQLNLLKSLSVLNIHGNSLLPSSLTSRAISEWICGAGHFDMSDADEMMYERAIRRCAKCAPGTFQPYIGQRSCVSCTEGTFAPDAGSTACIVCKPGTVIAGGTKCQCPANTDPDTCVPCPASKPVSADGSECRACEDGSVFVAGTGTSTGTSTAGSSSSGRCESCPTNFFWQADSRECVPCPAGLMTLTFSSANGGTTSTNRFATRQDCISPPGFLSYNSSSMELHQCPIGASCPIPGTTVKTLVPLQGFWRASETSTTLYACPGGSYACPSKWVAVGGEGKELLRACEVTRTGAFCDECIDGYAKRKGGGYADSASATMSAVAKCELCNSDTIEEDRKAFVTLALVWFLVYALIISLVVVVVLNLERISVCIGSSSSSSSSSSASGGGGQAQTCSINNRNTGSGRGSGSVAVVFVGKGMILLGYLQVRK